MKNMIVVCLAMVFLATANAEFRGPLTGVHHGNLVETPRGLRPLDLEGFSEDLDEDGYVDPLVPVAQRAVAPVPLAAAAPVARVPVPVAAAAPVAFPHITPAQVAPTLVSHPYTAGYPYVGSPSHPYTAGYPYVGSPFLHQPPVGFAHDAYHVHRHIPQFALHTPPHHVRHFGYGF